MLKGINLPEAKYMHEYKLDTYSAHKLSRNRSSFPLVYLKLFVEYSPQTIISLFLRSLCYLNAVLVLSGYRLTTF